MTTTFNRPGSPLFQAELQNRLVSRQVEEWDAQMDGLDKQAETLLNEQWRLLRTQIASLMGTISDLRVELDEVKGRTSKEQLEAAFEQIQSNLDAHGHAHASIAERVTYLEDFIGESADKQDMSFETLAGEHEALKGTIEQRLEYLEGFIGESSDKHAKDIAEAMGKLQDMHKAVSSCAQQKHHASLEERMTFMEKELGESADKHGKHKTSVETRMQFLEKTIGDSAEKHWKEIKDAKTKLGDLSKAISTCAKQEHHATLEERLKFLEKELGESADKHDKHKTSVEDRMEFIEKKIGDSAELHWKEIQDSKAKLGDVSKAIALCAKKEHHASLEERIGFIEKEMGESADKHDKHKTSMETRMEFLENKVGDSAELHWKEILDAKTKLGDLHEAIATCAKQEHHATLEERLNFLEKELGESADKHDKHKTSVEDRMEFIEKKIGDSAELHWQEIQDSKAKLGDVSKALELCAMKENHASLEERIGFIEKEMGESAEKHDSHKTSMETRMEFLENKLGDSAEKHWTEIEDAKAKLGDLHEAISQTAKYASSLDKRLDLNESAVGDNADRHTKGIEEHKASMETRLNYLEALIGDSADKHMKEIDAASKQLGSVEAAISMCAKAEHHDVLEARVAYLEKDLGASLDQHTQSKNSIEGRLANTEKLLNELGISLNGKIHKNEIEKLESAVLAGIGTKLTAMEEKQLKDFMMRLSDYERKHMQEFDQIRGKIGDVDKALKECASIEHYLGLDRKHGALKEEHASQVEAAKGRMRDFATKVDGQVSLFQSYKSVMDERLSQLEDRLADRSQSRDVMKDVEERMKYMQEDQKRARDILESSILEQIRLEHSTVTSQASQLKEQWDRELKTRQAYLDNYSDLLGQERSARVGDVQQMEGKMKTFETSLFHELQRIWQELGKEAPVPAPIIVQQPPSVVKEYVMPPVYTSTPAVTGNMSPPMMSFTSSPSVAEYRTSPIMSPRVATVLQGRTPGPLGGTGVVRSQSMGMVGTVPIGTTDVPYGSGAVPGTGSVIRSQSVVGTLPIGTPFGTPVPIGTGAL
jgi:hypothetical protein